MYCSADAETTGHRSCGIFPAVLSCRGSRHRRHDPGSASSTTCAGWRTCPARLEVDVKGPATQRSVLDALEASYPMLRGTIRDHGTQQRRPMLRFFACEEDVSHEPADAPLPEAIVSGKEPATHQSGPHRRRLGKKSGYVLGNELLDLAGRISARAQSEGAQACQ